MKNDISRQDYLHVLSKAYNSLTENDPEIIKNIILNTIKDVKSNKDLTRCALDLTCRFSRKIFLSSKNRKIPLTPDVKEMYDVSLKMSERYRRWAGGINVFH